VSSLEEPVPAEQPAPVEPEAPEVEGVTAEVVEDDIEALDALDVLSATEKERDEYLDALRRLQADFENYKKRMQRLQSETLERAGEGLASKLLPVLDTLDLAKQHGAGEGVDQIATALHDVLAKEGLERIDPVGEAFDPNEHEAVSHEPAGEGDDGEPKVSGLMRAGYRWKGRLLRAAMVTVRG
jgi:molecular chaperone GrpE